VSVSDTGAQALFPLRRAAEERQDPALVDTLRADETTLALAVAGDLVSISGSAEDPRVRLVAAAGLAASEWAFLGRTVDGRGVLAAVTETVAEPFARLREIGGLLPEAESDAATTAVALGVWLREQGYCPFCGTRTELRQSGWARHCPHCGREHFPRTDPAIIVAVHDADGPNRLLLGSNAAWPAGRYSCFAGFAEAGESLEDAVAREVAEEAGVELVGVRYHGSQAWPYPRSLMLGFHAAARIADAARPDGDEIVEVRWFTREEIGDALEGRGEVVLPGSASISWRLIRDWYEGRA